MANENKEGLEKKFGSSLLAGAQGLTKEKPAKRAPQVRVAKNTYMNMLGVKILKAVGAAFIVLVVIYLSFAATIMRVLPTEDLGMIPVKNNTFEGGLVPAGERIVVSMSHSQGQEATDYLQQAFVPTKNAAVIEVLAGPWGKFGWAEPGLIAIDGEVIDGVFMDEPAQTTLESAYLAVCVEGACTPGQAYVIPSSNILGIPIGE